LARGRIKGGPSTAISSGLWTGSAAFVSPFYRGPEIKVKPKLAATIVINKAAPMFRWPGRDQNARLKKNCGDRRLQTHDEIE